jgi:hypothetical protein
MIRGQRVILDADLAALYDMPAKVLNQAIKRNLEHFPSDFTFKFNAEAIPFLRSQLVTASGPTLYYPSANSGRNLALSSC